MSGKIKSIEDLTFTVVNEKDNSNREKIFSLCVMGLTTLVASFTVAALFINTFQVLDNAFMGIMWSNMTGLGLYTLTVIVSQIVPSKIIESSRMTRYMDKVERFMKIFCFSLALTCLVCTAIYASVNSCLLKISSDTSTDMCTCIGSTVVNPRPLTVQDRGGTCYVANSTVIAKTEL
ncbi:hypothetical protein DM01DRAFT_1340806 [Hesseltinella vesiculosa]|uniref:Uncharacterized protein n=1 Tax=Hesseltinella vesiculosa TaxID=101127 RepID=A0A1X2G2S3_9FUNG|nr:hypothetical protein DM01DRAFT_1340806 [Hesseltinella vesiculosa]